MKKYIVLDFEKCVDCKDRICQCSYPYHYHNSGPDALIEAVIFNYICKQCEEAPCVRSCTKEALERSPGVNLKRYNTRCIDCNSCVLACPFGVIMPRAVTYLSSKCDLCIGRLSGSENPVCIASCPYGALEYVEINQADQEDMHFVNDNFVVRYISWKNPKSQEI